MRIAVAVTLAAAVALAGCAGTPAPAPATPSGRAGAGATASRGDEPEAGSAVRPEALRSLAPNATFADLVAAARALDDAGASDSSAGCLLARPGPRSPGWHLRADVAVAVRPLPEAPDGLAARVAGAAAPVSVLSRWGQRGPATAPLALVTFTSGPPLGEGPVPVLIATADGVRRRATAKGASGAGAAPAPWSDPAPALAGLAGAPAVIVTADGRLPLARLADLLARLPEEGPVAVLAVALVEGTRLPSPIDAAQAGAPLCPDGLPPIPEGVSAGELSAEDATAAIHPLAKRFPKCVQAFPEAARGGRLQVFVRVGAEGKVRNACIADDSIGSAGLRRCVLDLIGEVTFPAPGGPVDLSFPIGLEPTPGIRQAPLCRE